jgi:hypothetical protein
MARAHRVGIVATFAVLLLFGAAESSILTATAGPSDFSFSYAGDFGSWGGFNESLRQLSQAGPDFAIAMGDLSYGGMPEEQWCASFRESFRNVTILAGNHETGLAGEVGGDINEFARHCPFPLDVPVFGTYAKEYYFDFPEENPLVRFVLLSPGLTFAVDNEEEAYDYGADTPRYNWVRSAIDGARALGIPWVAVGSHKVCVGAGDHGCEIGTDLFNLLLDRRVDLILQAHNHHYARSHQLGLTEACGGIVLHHFDPGCIVDDGSDGAYSQGVGSVVVIAGTGGRDIEPFNVSDPHAGYFAARTPDDLLALGKGVVTFRVSPNIIMYETNFNGSYRDTFTLTMQPQVSFLETMTRSVPLIAPAVVLLELLLIATVVFRQTRRGTAQALGPSPRPNRRRAAPSREPPDSRTRWTRL